MGIPPDSPRTGAFCLPNPFADLAGIFTKPLFPNELELQLLSIWGIQALGIEWGTVIRLMCKSFQ
jgi:hypothetical protein